MRTVEAEVDGGLHPLVVEERLQLLAGRRGLLPCLQQPTGAIHRLEQPTTPTTRTEKKIGSNPASGLG